MVLSRSIFLDVFGIAFPIFYLLGKIFSSSVYEAIGFVLYEFSHKQIHIEKPISEYYI